MSVYFSQWKIIQFWIFIFQFFPEKVWATWCGKVHKDGNMVRKYGPPKSGEIRHTWKSRWLLCKVCSEMALETTIKIMALKEWLLFLETISVTSDFWVNSPYLPSTLEWKNVILSLFTLWLLLIAPFIVVGLWIWGDVDTHMLGCGACIFL